ncbi:hypothetical protein AB0B89_20885 [Sphaerisporangium sp. NPDC049002]
MNKKIVSLDDLSNEPTAIDEADLFLVAGGMMSRCYSTGGHPATDWVSDY